MKKAIMTLVLLLAFSLAFAQDILPWSKDVNTNAIEVDRLGNIYLINNNVVSKYDADMNFLCAYDNYPAGSMSSLDVSNPFKVMVFYSEFNKLIYLDSKLAELLSPVMLDDAGLYNIKVVCTSSFGGFWVFDSQNSCVRRVNPNLEVSQQGTNIFDKLGDAEVLAMRESINYLFLLTDEGNVLILDKFGNFYRTFNAEGSCSDFCIDNDILYYSHNGEIIAYDVADDKTIPIPIPTNGQKADKFRIRHDQLYLLVDNKLVSSKIQLEK